MKHWFVILFASGTLLLATAAFAAPALRVTLEAVPDTTLPAIPVSLRATIENISDRPVAVPRNAFLMVKTAGGKTFEASRYSLMSYTRETNNAIELEDWPETTLQPSERVTLTIEATGTLGVITEPEWFKDERLHVPGSYELRLLLGEGLTGDRPLDSIRSLVTAESTWARLDVAIPGGDDALVWDAMQEFKRTHDRRELDVPRQEEALWTELVKKYPSSTYTPWLLTTGWGAAASEQNALLRQWMEKHPNDPHNDWRWLGMAELESTLDAHTKDEAEARRHENAMREILNRITKNTKSAKMKKAAAEILAPYDDSDDQ